MHGVCNTLTSNALGHDITYLLLYLETHSVHKVRLHGRPFLRTFICAGSRVAVHC